MDVSFIIPAYKSENTLRQCLNGILRQAISARYEIIVVVSCPNKKELEILNEIKETYPLQVIPTSLRNRSHSRNVGTIRR